METILKNKLQPDETLLWTGKPEAFEVLDSTHKPAYVKKCIFTVIAMVAVLAWYVATVISKGQAIKPVMIVLVLAVGAYIIVSDLLDANKLRNKTLYALTDQRLISIIGGNCESAVYEHIDCYEFVTDEDGHVSLICGQWPKEEASRLRRTATLRGACNNSETGECKSFAMYALDDVDAMKPILAKYMPA